MRRQTPWFVVTLWSLCLVGCAGGAASGMLGMLVALVMSGGLLLACSGDTGSAVGADGVSTGQVDTSEPGDASTDATTADVSTPVDTTTPPSDAEACDGAWEPCCTDGVVTTCCCENGADCNYGMFVTCDDGSCGVSSDACPAPEPDAEVASDVVGDVSELADTTVQVVDSGLVSDSGPTSDVPGPQPPDAVADIGASECDGEWQICCEAGIVSTCCCPEGAACNFGWMEDCGDGTCVYPPETCTLPEADVVEPADTETVPDVVTEDAGPEECDGTWQTCCTDGELAQCCCPEGAICNYWYEPCPDGGCTFPGEPCAEPEPQCDGAWEACCVDGMIDQCCCPEGVACNYGDFNDCGDGSCVGPVDMCPEPEPECDGTWQSCCLDGLVDQCCCPDGMACNYGMFNNCGDGTCVGMPEECKESE